MRRKRLLYGLYLLLLIPLLTEGGLRALKYRPYQHQVFSVTSQPKTWLAPDSMLGFRLGQGNFKVSVNEGLVFNAHHLTDGGRFLGRDSFPFGTPTIDLYGCSYAYGYGLDDSLCLGWLLQKELVGMKVRNWSVPGYGNVQALLLLEQQLQRSDTPAVVIILYASFHDDRNALSAAYRKDLSLGFAHNQNPENFRKFRYPYLGEDNQIHYQSWKDLYTHWAGREYSATINLLQTVTEQWQKTSLRKQERSLWVFQKLQKLCEEADIPLLVGRLDKNEESLSMLINLAQSGIDTLDMGLDLQKKQYQNYPFDTHPNALAHRHYAEKLKEYILHICPEANYEVQNPCFSSP